VREFAFMAFGFVLGSIAPRWALIVMALAFLAGWTLW